jgi:hypothetical protein
MSEAFALPIPSLMTLFSVPSLIPETKGRSMEDMDIIFGSISAEERRANIEKHEKQGGILLGAFS